MCTYNGEKFLQEQLETIVAQTYPIYELIIQDDHSTDGTLSLLWRYENRYPFIHVYQNETQKGINNNFLSAIERATGDYIAISDQDDLWELDKIERQVHTIGESLLSAGLTRPFSQKGSDAIVHFDNRSPNIHLERILYTSMVAGHTMMFRKELINCIPDIYYWLDHIMYDHLFQIVAATYESINYCPHILVNQRKHIDSATYSEPNNYSKTLSNILQSISRTFKHHRRLRFKMKRYFDNIYMLLDSLEVKTHSKKNAMLLSKYHYSDSVLDFIRLSFLCVKLRDKIFHTPEKNPVLSVCRALYFPVSCSDYFRYMDKNTAKNKR